jgi:hypothetical protein
MSIVCPKPVLANRRSPKTVFPGGFALNSAQGPFFNATITGSTKTTVTIAGAAGFEGKVAMVRYGWGHALALLRHSDRRL